MLLMENWDGEERRESMFDKDFYDKMMETHTNVKYMRNWIQEHKTEDDSRHEKLDNRLKIIEGDRLKIIGGASVFGVIGGFLAKWFLK